MASKKNEKWSPLVIVHDLMDGTDRWLQSRINQLDLSDKELSEIAGQSEAAMPEQVREINVAVAGHFIIRNEIKFEDYNHLFGVLDQKSSALLTHISVMSAVTAIVISTNQLEFPILDLLSILFLIAYISTAFVVLRLLRFWSFGAIDFLSLKEGTAGFSNHDFDVPLSEGSRTDAGRRRFFEIVMRKELFFRSRLYRTCLNITSVITAASLVLLLLYLISYICNKASHLFSAV